MSSAQIIQPFVIRYEVNNVLIGTINGINVTFQTPYKFIPGSISVYVNGLKMMPGIGNDFVEDNSTNDKVILASAPLSGDILLADYRRLLP